MAAYTILSYAYLAEICSRDGAGTQSLGKFLFALYLNAPCVPLREIPSVKIRLQEFFFV